MYFILCRLLRPVKGGKPLTVGLMLYASDVCCKSSLRSHLVRPLLHYWIITGNFMRYLRCGHCPGSLSSTSITAPLLAGPLRSHLSPAVRPTPCTLCFLPRDAPYQGMPGDNIPPQKYRNTGISRYLTTSSIVDNFENRKDSKRTKMYILKAATQLNVFLIQTTQHTSLYFSKLIAEKYARSQINCALWVSIALDGIPRYFTSLRCI